MKKVKKGEKVFEIKFNSEKEKIFIITKRFLTTQEMVSYLELLNIQNKNNIFVLPNELIESITIVKDVRKHRTKKRNGK